MPHKNSSTLKRFIGIPNSSNERDGDERGGEANISKQRRGGIVQLPPEILLLIRSFLSLTSQACLALTCKTFFCVSAEVLGSREFGLPPWQRERNEKVWTPGRSLRWELLRLLEDARWLFCPKCVKLHPIMELPCGSRSTECAKRSHEFSPDDRGIVEICPCIRMTFADKLKLVAQLEAERGKASTENSSFWHECLTTRGTQTVRVQAQPYLQEDGGLIFQIRYEIVCSGSIDMWPIWCCCQIPLEYTIRKLKTPPTSPTWILQPSGSQHFIICHLCQTTVGDFTTVQNANAKVYTFQATRNLGNGRWQRDQAWDSQCSLLTRKMIKNERKRERENRKK